jgi:WD40 repeat protein
VVALVLLPSAQGAALRTDDHGDPLPEGASARLGTVRFRHDCRVCCLAFSPDGGTIVTGDEYGVIRVWEVPTGKPVRAVGHRGNKPLNQVFAISSIQFAPDGKSFLSIDRFGDLHQWETATGKRLRAWDGHGSSFVAVSRKLDVLAIVSTDGRQIELLNLAAGRDRRALEVRKGQAEFVTFSPDGKTVAAAVADAEIQLWDVTTGKRLRVLRNRGPVLGTPFVFSPDGKTIAGSGSDETVRVWDAATGKQVRSWKNLDEPSPVASSQIFAVALSPDGTMLATSDFSGRTCLRELATGKTLRVWRNGGLGGAFSPDGKTVALGVMHQRITLWSVGTGKELPQPAGHGSAVTAVTFSPDGKEMASSAEGIRRWDPFTGKALSSSVESGGRVHALAFSPDGKVLASGGERSSFDSTGRLVLWDTASQKAIHELRASNWQVSAVTFSPDGKSLAVASREGRIAVWQVATGRWLTDLSKGEATVSAGCGPSLAFSPDGKLLASADDEGLIRLWAAGTKTKVADFPSRTREVRALAFSPDGDLLACGGADGTVRLWRMPTHRIFAELPGQADNVLAIAFSPDGRFLASAYADWSGQPATIYLYEVATGQHVRPLGGHQGTIHSVAFSPDGLTLASGSADTTVLLWNLSEVLNAGPLQRLPLAPHELDELWTDLAGHDAGQAQRAVWRLIQAPRQAVPFLHDHLHPINAADLARIPQLIEQLGNERFAVRNKALGELEKLHDLAEPALEQVLAGRPTLDVQRQAQGLLDKVQGPIRSPELRRAIRAIEALEYIGGPQAREVLQVVAKGVPEARLTREAKAALTRLGRRSGK